MLTFLLFLFIFLLVPLAAAMALLGIWLMLFAGHLLLGIFILIIAAFMAH